MTSFLVTPTSLYLLFAKLSESKLAKDEIPPCRFIEFYHASASCVLHKAVEYFQP
jgi:hypothetical protein